MFLKNKNTRNEKGVVMAEAALTLPLLAGILYIMFEIGNVFYLSNSLNQIARTAARYAAINQSYTDSSLLTFALTHESSTTIPHSSNVSISVSPTPGTQSVGDTITVTLTYAYTPLVNPMGLLSPGSTWAPSIMATAISRAEVGV